MAQEETFPPDLCSPNYYILSNDEVPGPLQFPASGKGWLFLGVGSPHVLHALAEVMRQCGISRVVFLDNNPRQLGHLLRLLRFIRESSNRADYLAHLFCGEITEEAREALDFVPSAGEGSIRGARQGGNDDGLWEPEQRFWSGFHLDVDLFERMYGRKVEQRPGGLLTSQGVVGEISRCMLTVACGTKERYPAWPFTAGYGSGFLRDEETFRGFRSALGDIPLSFVTDDITTNCQRFFRYFRYQPIAFWASNLFDEWFAERYPGIRELHKEIVVMGTQREPHFPELDIYLIQDERSTWPVPRALSAGPLRRRPRLSIHSRTFREVACRMRGTRNLEVVNMPEWIARDGGRSKLPCTEYKMLRDLEEKGLDGRYETVFLHILSGHGTPRAWFREGLPALRSRAARLLILEHHPRSPDFWNARGLLSPEDIREVLGEEDELVHIRGNRPWVRNFLMVYDK